MSAPIPSDTLPALIDQAMETIADARSDAELLAARAMLRLAFPPFVPRTEHYRTLAARGYTQAQIADACGVTRAAVCQWQTRHGMEARKGKRGPRSARFNGS